jgi:hypothetical protein
MADTYMPPLDTLNFDMGKTVVNLKLKTRLEQLKCSIPLAMTLPQSACPQLALEGMTHGATTLSLTTMMPSFAKLCRIFIGTLRQGTLTDGEGSVQLTSLY